MLTCDHKDGITISIVPSSNALEENGIHNLDVSLMTCTLTLSTESTTSHGFIVLRKVLHFHLDPVLHLPL
jgi:hypothetical protein